MYRSEFNTKFAIFPMMGTFTDIMVAHISQKKRRKQVAFTAEAFSALNSALFFLLLFETKPHWKMPLPR